MRFRVFPTKWRYGEPDIMLFGREDVMKVERAVYRGRERFYVQMGLEDWSLTREEATDLYEKLEAALLGKSPPAPEPPGDEE